VKLAFKILAGNVTGFLGEYVRKSRVSAWQPARGTDTIPTIGSWGDRLPDTSSCRSN